MNVQLRIFIISCGADFLFIIYFCFVVYSYSYSQLESGRPHNHSQVYQSPSEQMHGHDNGMMKTKESNVNVKNMDGLGWNMTKKHTNGMQPTVV
jgi:hypothetical protein